MSGGYVGDAGPEVSAMNTGTVVAIVGAAVALVAWLALPDTMFGAGLFGFGLAHVVLGMLDAAFDRRSVRAGNVE